jgi:hypothetical protein
MLRVAYLLPNKPNSNANLNTAAAAPRRNNRLLRRKRMQQAATNAAWIGAMPELKPLISQPCLLRN